MRVWLPCRPKIRISRSSAKTLPFAQHKNLLRLFRLPAARRMATLYASQKFIARAFLQFFYF
jgi:hypothetical protein